MKKKALSYFLRQLLTFAQSRLFGDVNNNYKFKEKGFINIPAITYYQ